MRTSEMPEEVTQLLQPTIQHTVMLILRFAQRW